MWPRPQNNKMQIGLWSAKVCEENRSEKPLMDPQIRNKQQTTSSDMLENVLNTCSSSWNRWIISFIQKLINWARMSFQQNTFFCFACQIYYISNDTCWVVQLYSNATSLCDCLSFLFSNDMFLLFSIEKWHFLRGLIVLMQQQLLVQTSAALSWRSLNPFQTQNPKTAAVTVWKCIAKYVKNAQTSDVHV